MKRIGSFRSGARKPDAPERDAAATLAIDALSWLASDLGQMSRFMLATGIDFDALRGAAEDPQLLVGVLDHICGDERLLIAFAAHIGVSPRKIEAAWHTLGGRRWERDVP